MLTKWGITARRGIEEVLELPPLSNVMVDADRVPAYVTDPLIVLPS